MVRLILPILIMLLIPISIEAVVINDAGTMTQGSSVALTASDSVYWPSSSGISIKNFEYFGYDIVMVETTGDSPSVTVTLETSTDETNWLAYTQTCFYPIDAAGSGTLTISDENHDQGSLHFKLSKKFRLKLTEGAADADITATIFINMQ